uniref:Uncharacterized protein n=1 Tax=Anguilla anguilla TaxID=7936 RepID=A0A0E9VZY7_ANGAN
MTSLCRFVQYPFILLRNLVFVP